MLYGTRERRAIMASLFSCNKIETTTGYHNIKVYMYTADIRYEKKYLITIADIRYKKK